MVLACIHTIISRLLLLLLMVVLCIPVGLLFLMPENWRYRSRLFFSVTHYVYWAMLKCALLPIKYVGLENLPANLSTQPVIFAANHQSSLDIPLVGMLTGNQPHIWMAWMALMKSPILRFILPYVTVLVDTTTAWTSVRSLLKVMDLVKKYAMHIIIFPEGGRYTSGKIHDFFGGFAILARRTQRQVVPVYINGINKAYPPKAFLVHWYPITVVIGKPFALQSNETDDAFKNRVHQWFVQQTEEFKH